MKIEEGLSEIINDSNDFMPGEQKLPWENQNNDIEFQNEPYSLNAEIRNCENYDDDYVFKKIVNNISSTGESSNDKQCNLIEKVGDEKDSEENFLYFYHNIESKKNDKLKSNIFLTSLPKKRGRTKMNDVIRKIHRNTDNDNVLTKLQTHFLTFLINACNDIIEPYFKAKKINNFFRQINYNIKKNIKTEHISYLKSCSIKDILQMEISKKYSECKKDNNKQLYNYIYEEAKKDEKLNSIINFFKMNYLDFFEQYYFIDKSEIQKIKINFSEKTKPFYDLLEKNRNNPEIQKCLKRISKRYLERIKQPSQRIFLINKIQKKFYFE